MWVCVIKHDFTARIAGGGDDGGWALDKKLICILKTSHYKALTIREGEKERTSGQWLAGAVDVTCTVKMHFIVHCCLAWRV